MIDKDKRIIFLDVIRTIAIISIVLDHAALIGYRLFYETYFLHFEKLTNLSKVIEIAIWEFSRWGVPLFLLLTGYLILNKEFVNEDKVKRFYKNNLFPLFVINEIWAILHWIIAFGLEKWNIPFVYTQTMNEIHIDIEQIVYSLLMIRRSCYPNMWYLPMIIGMYIFLPYITRIVKDYWNIVSKVLFFSICVLFATSDVAYILKLIGLNYSTKPIISLSFGGGIYGIYIVMGYYLSKKDTFLKSIKTRILFMMFIVIELVDIVLTLNNFNSGQIVSLFEYNDSFFQLMIVVILVELISRIQFKDNIISKLIVKISKLSFPVYLIHYPIMLIVDNYMKNLEYSSIRVLLDFVITMIICLLLGSFIPNNEKIRKYGFHVPMNS